MIVNTRDIGLAIAQALEGGNLRTYYEGGDGELEPGPMLWAGSIAVDASDPDNLRVTLTNGQQFTVRIIAG